MRTERRSPTLSKTFPGNVLELQIPPLRYASVGMTKGRVVLPSRFDAMDDEQQVPPLRCAPVGMTDLSRIWMLVPIQLFGTGMLVPTQLCHPDRSVPGFPATMHWTSP